MSYLKFTIDYDANEIVYAGYEPTEPTGLTEPTCIYHLANKEAAEAVDLAAKFSIDLSGIPVTVKT